MTTLHILYISLTGNTQAFLRQLTTYCGTQNVTVETKNVKDIVSKKIPFEKLTEPFACFLPTFMEGGNGVDNGYREILTTPLHDYLTFADNYKLCYGIVGSGNRNFNRQFALSAKQYAADFGFPFLDEFEMRGTKQDAARIGDKLIALATEHEK